MWVHQNQTSSLPFSLVEVEHLQQESHQSVPSVLPLVCHLVREGQSAQGVEGDRLGHRALQKYKKVFLLVFVRGVSCLLLFF